MKNKFPSICKKCRCTIEAGEGDLIVSNGRYEIVHQCRPRSRSVSVTPFYSRIDDYDYSYDSNNILSQMNECDFLPDLGSK